MDRIAEDDSLTPEEKAALAALPRAQHPGARLEDRVVEALRARGTIRPGRGWLRLRPALAGAAAAALFLMGLTLGRSSARPAPVPIDESGRQWLLLLYSDGGFELPVLGQEAARRAEGDSWPRGLAAQGVLLDGREVADETLLLGGCGDVLVAKASARAEQRVLLAYYILRAPTLEKALEIAKTSPHLSYGGIVTLSEIVTGRKQSPGAAHIRVSMLAAGAGAAPLALSATCFDAGLW